MKFHPGRVVGTPGVTNDPEIMQALPAMLVAHIHGDWGDIDPEDKELNEDALKTGARILSIYMVGKEKVYVITDAAWYDDPKVRQVTTVLLPSEY